MGCFYSCPSEARIRIIAVMDSIHKAGDLFAAAHYIMVPGFEVRGIIGWDCRKVKEIIKMINGEKNINEGEITVLSGRLIKEAAEFIRKEAEAKDERPLFLCVWGKLDIIAAAYAMNPALIEKLTVIWMKDGNISGTAEKNVLNSQIPLWLMLPSACQKIRVTVMQLRQRLAAAGEIGEYFSKWAEEFCRDDFLDEAQGEALVLEAEAAIAALLTPSEYAYKFMAIGPRSVRVYDTIDNRFVLEDFFARLALAGQTA